MHDGIRTLKTDALAPHPVQAIQANVSEAALVPKATTAWELLCKGQLI